MLNFNYLVKLRNHTVHLYLSTSIKKKSNMFWIRRNKLFNRRNLIVTLLRTSNISRNLVTINA